jgi:ApaG protein
VLNAALMAEAKKYEIKVTVTTHYVAEQSDPAINRHVFAYTIGIQNTGNVSAQLISRHWLITDAEGQVQEVRGLGVVGSPAACWRPARASNTPAAASWRRRSAP